MDLYRIESKESGGRAEEVLAASLRVAINEALRRAGPRSIPMGSTRFVSLAVHRVGKVDRIARMLWSDTPESYIESDTEKTMILRVTDERWLLQGDPMPNGYQVFKKTYHRNKIRRFPIGTTTPLEFDPKDPH